MTVERLDRIVTKPPADLLPPAGRAMSNFDGIIEAGFEDDLRAGHVGDHYAWEFKGMVWFAEGHFFETVWRYNVAQATYASPELDALRRSVNDDWGWE